VAVVGLSSLLAGDAEGLTREATTDEIDSSKPTQSLCVNGVNVFDAGNVRPMLPEDGSAVFVSFAERNSSHPCSLESEGEAADAGEEVEDIHTIPARLGLNTRK